MTRVGLFGRDARIGGVAIGVLGPVALSAAMLPLRGHVSNVCMALVLVIPVLAGSFTGGRIAGIASAVTATTRVRLLLHAAVPHPAHHQSERHRNCDRAAGARLDSAPKSAIVSASTTATPATTYAAFDRLCRVAELSARGTDLEDVVSSARAELMGLFDLDDCTFESVDSATPPLRLSIDGTLEGLPARSQQGCTRPCPWRCFAPGHRTRTELRPTRALHQPTRTVHAAPASRRHLDRRRTRHHTRRATTRRFRMKLALIGHCPNQRGDTGTAAVLHSAESGASCDRA